MKMKWIKKRARETNADDSIMLKLKKIRNIENLNHFLEPPISFEHSPYLLSNIDEAVQRIIKGIHNRENITIMSDVDADGICSCSIMYNYLKGYTSLLDIAHAQRSHGHGLETIVEEMTENENVRFLTKDTELLIIVDSSSNSVEACKLVKEEYGCDIIIIDHHAIDVDNPHAIIVNCQLGDYPNKNLSGSAMCYKVLQVIDEYFNDSEADNYLDLVAIGLVADLMDLNEGENRSLVNRGIQHIRNEGLQQLLKTNNVDFYYGITSTDIGYKISPLINACSRYDKLELAIELFVESDVTRAKEIAKELKKLNEQRKKEEKEIIESVINDVDNTHKVAVIVNNDIEANFRGLICMQVTSKLKKPAFVLTYNKETNEYHGSARSVGQVKLKNYCQLTGDFLYCQGHEKAFGLGVKAEKLEEALSTLDELIENDESEEVLEYDLDIEATEITHELITDVEKFSRITGQNVPPPKFLVKGCIVQNAEMLGKKVQETLKLSCENDLSLMKFKIDKSYAETFIEALKDEDRFFVEVDVLGTLNLNRFYHFGKKELQITKQIFMEDYKLYD
jgi:single-stranded-DNA-specific exonuclease